MTAPIHFQANDLHLLIGFNEKGAPCIQHLGATPPPAHLKSSIHHHLHQIRANQLEHGWIWDGASGDRNQGSIPGIDLIYHSHEIVETERGRELRIVSEGDGLRATAIFAAYRGTSCLRCWQEVKNISAEERVITRMVSLFVPGIDGSRRDRTLIHRSTNGWCGEMQWHQVNVTDAGVAHWREKGSSSFKTQNSGSWSSKRWLPMGALEDLDAQQCLIWQVESGASWQWEIGDIEHQLYLCAGGPDEENGNWWINLSPDDSYQSVPVAISAANGGFSDALASLNAYRRAMRRPSWDNEKLPVIFNDYMNCLFADPSTEKERPLIAAAAKAGCEVYCIDAGWYAKEGESWWSTVGEWQPQNSRFPDGLPALLNEIRTAGMVPGLWLELETMGVHCPLVKTWPKEAFFRNHGRPCVKGGRYQLDFRHPKALAHANEVVDRLVLDYGVGYIKMDYNIDIGVGTEVNAASTGAGLEGHVHAYHQWLEKVFQRHPDLVIENCGSGGLRMDYAKLRLHSIQSSSDQEDYRLYAYISPALATGACPEQQAVWSYPKRDGDLEEARFNMVNAMVGRIHQSGHLADLSAERFEAVCEGIAVYKTLRDDLKQAHASWPLGLPSHGDAISCVMMSHENRHFIAVWNIRSEQPDLEIHLPELKKVQAKLIYPAGCGEPRWDEAGRILHLPLDVAPSARIYSIESN